MSHIRSLIYGLERLKKAEQHTAQYYSIAAADAEEREGTELVDLFRSIRHVHSEFALQFEARAEQLHQDEGEGIWGEAFHAFVDALRSVVEDLPVLFFENMTHPTPASLVEIEQSLSARYESLLEHADEATERILKEASTASKKHVERLREAATV